MEVEVIKIGEFVGNPDKPVLMVIDEFSDDASYYIKILRKNIGNKYAVMKTGNGIIRQPTFSNYKAYPGFSDEILKGNPDGEPILGRPFTINNGLWQTTPVLEIIDGCIIITKNSVYALQSKLTIRERKLNNLGL